MILRNREHRRNFRFVPELFTAGMVTFTMFSMQTPAQETETADLAVTENIIGTLNGHDYELWKDSGNTEMIMHEEAASEKSAAPAEVDIDLSVMPASVVYAQATSMQKEPEDYAGKLVRIAGTFNK